MLKLQVSSLELLSLKAPSTTDPVIVLIVGSVVVAAIMITLVSVTIAVKKKRKENELRLIAEAKKR